MHNTSKTKMKTDNTLKPKSTLEFVLNSHSTLFENSSIHPAFKIADSIYSAEKNLLYDKLNGTEKSEKSPTKTKPLSMTPVPAKCYRDPINKSPGKEDIFLNPSAFYLSRKPVAFNKQARELQRKRNLSQFIPLELKDHKKNKSQDITLIKHKFNPQLPKLPPTHLVPMEAVRSVSPRLGAKPKQTHEVHCEALAQIANFCNNCQASPSPSLAREKNLVMKYSEKMKWISEILHEYGEYDYKILKELYRYSDDTRDELESQRADIVHLMRIGVLDPNKNIIKLRASVKKHKERIN